MKMIGNIDDRHVTEISDPVDGMKADYSGDCKMENKNQKETHKKKNDSQIISNEKSKQIKIRLRYCLMLLNKRREHKGRGKGDICNCKGDGKVAGRGEENGC